MKCHRVGWALHYGEQPPDHIDHINGNKADNRINNLRATSPSQNIINQRRIKVASSGVVGVSWDKATSLWEARVSRRRIGRFKTLEQAANARHAAVRKAFGEFAPPISRQWPEAPTFKDAAK